MNNEKKTGDIQDNNVDNINTQKKEYKNHNKIKIPSFFYWMSGVSILLSVIAICTTFINGDVIVQKESIVLVFVGILATFIVIGNYMQVYNIQKEFEKKSVENKEYTNAKIESLKNDLLKSINKSNAKIDELASRCLRYGKIPIEVKKIEIYSIQYNSEDGYVKINDTIYLTGRSQHIVSGKEIELDIVQGWISYEYYSNDYTNVLFNNKKFTSDTTGFIKLGNFLDQFSDIRGRI